MLDCSERVSSFAENRVGLSAGGSGSAAAANNGNIVIIETDIANLAVAETAFKQSAGAKMAALAPQYGDGRFLTVK